VARVPFRSFRSAGATRSSPRRSRSRTSFAVAGEIPAALAISRKVAWGRALISCCALKRPSAASSGLTRPSRPSLDGPWASAVPARRRIVATVPAAKPVAWPIQRSDRCGWQPSMRCAAALRSASVNGSPWMMLARTAAINASSASPSKNLTSTLWSPRNCAARRRCIPSMTRMVCRCTTIGGQCTPASASTVM
jgi:hypothetical protein